MRRKTSKGPSRKNAMIVGLNKLQKATAEKKKKIKEPKRPKAIVFGKAVPIEGPEKLRRVFDAVEKSNQRAISAAKKLCDSSKALEIRLRLKTIQPNQAAKIQVKDSKTGSSVLGMRRPGGQTYVSADPVGVDDGEKSPRTRNIATRHKVHVPTHDQVHTALEKLMRKKTFDRHTAIQEMNEHEREYELKQIKMKRFCDNLAKVMSVLYAMFVVVFGSCTYFAHIYIVKETKMMEIFNIYLCAVGLLWLAWLHYDITNYVKFILKYWTSQQSQVDTIHLVKNEDGVVELDLPSLRGEDENVIPEFYIFSTERHSGSYFLKIGAGMFCMGHVIHLVLNLAQYFSQFENGDEAKVKVCGNPVIGVEIMLTLLYALAMLFVIFRYSNMIVNRKGNCAKFGFMHLIASCTCFWLHAIIMETFITETDHYIHEYNLGLQEAAEGHGEESHGDHERGNYRLRTSMPMNPRSSLAAPETAETLDDDPFDCNNLKVISHSCFIQTMVRCTINNTIAESVSSAAPYLFPFSMEYGILIVGIWLVMWSHVGTTEHHVASQTRFVPDHIEFQAQKKHQTEEDALFTREDCATSATGVAAGCGFLAVAITGLIAFYVLATSEESQIKKTLAYYVSDTIHSLLLFLMTLSCIKVYSIISELDVNPHPVEFLDDLLLFVCIPSHVILACCIIAPSVYYMVNLGLFMESIGQVVVNMLMVIQITIQTPMLVDGLTRCSENPYTQKAKPGRNYVSFLLVANLVIYLWDNIKVKAGVEEDAPSAFYAGFLWKIIHHSCLPLTLFYRFHSAVALSDIWEGAYASGDHEDHFHDEYERIHIERSHEQDGEPDMNNLPG